MSLAFFLAPRPAPEDRPDRTPPFTNQGAGIIKNINHRFSGIV